MQNIFFNKWIDNLFKLKGRNSDKKLIKKLLLKQGFKKNFKIINIVGTNGKGSITQYINDELIEQGFKVGKFSSPHLFSFNERISINNINISNEEFYKLVNPELEKYKKDKIMWFAITYITAMIYFFNNNIDFAVLEAGIGGLKDPTSIIDGDWAVVSSIGLDHMELFKTRYNLCYEKANIINQNMKFFIPSSLKRKDKKIFINILETKQIQYKIIKNNSYDYQIRNQKLANGIIKEITNKNIKNFNSIFGRTTIKKVNNNIVVYDVAHNEDGIKSVIKKLKKQKIKIEQVVLSLSKNKYDANINKIFKVPIFIYEHKGQDAKKINDFQVGTTKIKDIKLFHKKINKNTLFIGSFYLLHDLGIEIKND